MLTQAKLSKLITKLDREKEGLCVSLVIPTYRTSTMRMQNPKNVQKVIRKVNSIIKGMSRSKATANHLIEKLDQLRSAVDHVHPLDGIGLFASSHVAEIIMFPFKVQEKIVVGDSFEMRDLYYYRQLAIEYYILHLTKDGAQLYTGCLDQAQEVHDDFFPVKFEDDYEYATPAPASSMRNALQSFERDKSQLRQIRQERNYKEINGLLGNYLLPDKSLIVSGAKEQVARFSNNYTWSNHLEGELTGNYTKDTIKLGRDAWKKLRSHKINHLASQQIKAIREGVGQDKVVTGIREVWKAAKDGRGLALYVEKDYGRSGYLAGDNQLYLSPPKGKYKRVEDIVDDAIEMAKTKGTEVKILENEKLRAFDHIALALRY